MPALALNNGSSRRAASAPSKDKMPLIDIFNGFREKCNGFAYWAKVMLEAIRGDQVSRCSIIVTKMSIIWADLTMS